MTVHHGFSTGSIWRGSIGRLRLVQNFCEVITFKMAATVLWAFNMTYQSDTLCSYVGYSLCSVIQDRQELGNHGKCRTFLFVLESAMRLSHWTESWSLEVAVTLAGAENGLRILRPVCLLQRGASYSPAVVVRRARGWPLVVLKSQLSALDNC